MKKALLSTLPKRIVGPPHGVLEWGLRKWGRYCFELPARIKSIGWRSMTSKAVFKPTDSRNFPAREPSTEIGIQFLGAQEYFTLIKARPVRAETFFLSCVPRYMGRRLKRQDWLLSGDFGGSTRIMFPQAWLEKMHSLFLFFLFFLLFFLWI